MRASPALISRMTIVILSFILVQIGVSPRLQPHLAMVCVLAGTVGLISYVGVKWAALRRNRATAYRVLAEWGYPPP